MRSQLTDIYHLDYSIFRRTKNVRNRRGNPGKTKKLYYKDLVCAFDIETSKDEEIEQAWMYIWQFQIDEFYTVIGRTWEEFQLMLSRIREQLYGNTIVIYVHNLSYEFTFLKGIFNFTEDQVFCTDERKVLKVDLLGFEFRCSYLLTNMSLKEFCKRYGKTRKESGDRFNYDAIRYPWTPLRRKQRKYCIADVVGLVQAIKGYLVATETTLYTISLTSTGFVRVPAKREMKKFNHQQLMLMLPDAKLLKYQLWMIRGGNTHSNRFYTGFVIKNKTDNHDISSSYPAELVLNPKPMTEWYEWTDPRSLSVDHLLDLIQEQYALTIHLSIWGLKFRHPLEGFPYIPRHKCKNLTNVILDNGRVISADYLETCINDQDFRIILNQYDFDAVEIHHLFSSGYKPLPSFLTDYIMALYRQKTELKGVDPLLYQLAKARINAIYGMMVQSSQFRDPIKFIDGSFVPVHYELEELVRKHNRKAFLSFSWGCWTTSGARLTLQRGLDAAAAQQKWPYYCDTDSIKGPEGIDLSALNAEILKKAEKAGAYADDVNGVRHYMGIFEKEDPYDEFITLGAKKYGFMKGGKLGITIAGVDKKKGAEELAKSGGLRNFKEGFVFRLAGGVEAVYNDHVDTVIEREGRQLRITDNVMLRDSTYTLGVTEDYQRILDNPIFWTDAAHLFD